MAGLIQLFTAYIVGGLTFIPLLLLAFYLHSTYLLPKPAAATKPSVTTGGAIFDGNEELKEKLLNRHHEPDVAVGYFAVCRDYVPGGANGKPPERTTPAGETIAMESPSVYQSMYRSIFERNKSQIPSLESGKAVKKARNVFYVVLRHGHLLLFDSSEQLEVRHVISLSLYDVDLYAGGYEIPEGELFIKRNCIRLVKRNPGMDDISRKFHLFSDNCSEKEDFYHALIHSQANNNSGESHIYPHTQLPDTEDMIKLVRALHLSDDLSQARWLNALAGRLFLGIYKTQFVEDFIRTKIEKKISRVSKPTFISSISLQQIDMGDSAPVVSNPKLKEITVDGNMILEADVKYSGCFKVVIGAVAKIELGSRFKPRTVTLVLATILKRLEGHVILRVKPPPSNRIWMSFETLPKMEISVEPVVSSRQITYSIILRAIESRIREVLGETLVAPNADDFPFFRTEGQTYRGGVWQREKQTGIDETLVALAEKQAEEEDAEDVLGAGLNDDSLAAANSKDKLTNLLPGSGKPVLDHQDVPATPTKMEKVFSDLASSPPSQVSTPPKLMRSNSAATAASPVVTKEDPALGGGHKHQPKEQRDAARSMKDLSKRSRETSPVVSSAVAAKTLRSSRFSRPQAETLDASAASLNTRATSSQPDLINGQKNTAVQEDDLSPPAYSSSRSSSIDQSASNNTDTDTSHSPHSKLSAAERKAALNQSLNSATSAAKKWGIGVLARQQDAWAKKAAAQASANAPTEPYGRGQPLPPPGVPLPRPATTWTATALNPLRRKPTASIGTSPPASVVSPTIPAITVTPIELVAPEDSTPQLPPRAAPRLPPRKPPQLPPRSAEESELTGAESAGLVEEADSMHQDKFRLGEVDQSRAFADPSFTKLMTANVVDDDLVAEGQSFLPQRPSVHSVESDELERRHDYNPQADVDSLEAHSFNTNGEPASEGYPEVEDDVNNRFEATPSVTQPTNADATPKASLHTALNGSGTEHDETGDDSAWALDDDVGIEQELGQHDDTQELRRVV